MNVKIKGELTKAVILTVCVNEALDVPVFMLMHYASRYDIQYFVLVSQFGGRSQVQKNLHNTTLQSGDHLPQMTGILTDLSDSMSVILFGRTISILWPKITPFRL